MKRLLLLAIAVLMLSTTGTVQAARNRYSSYRTNTGNGGVFSRMMELERRKNARLRQIFFGR